MLVSCLQVCEVAGRNGCKASEHVMVHIPPAIDEGQTDRRAYFYTYKIAEGGDRGPKRGVFDMLPRI